MAVAPSASAPALPELAAVPWRPRASADSLRRRGQIWTAYTIAHIVPFIAAAAVLVALDPIAIPVAFACVAHAWIIPELYASRGANVVRRSLPTGVMSTVSLPRMPSRTSSTEMTILGSSTSASLNSS